MEAGIFNLTQGEAPVLVDWGKEKTQTWLMTRLECAEAVGLPCAPRPRPRERLDRSPRRLGSRRTRPFGYAPDAFRTWRSINALARFLGILLTVAILIGGPSAYAAYRNANFRNFRVVEPGVLYRIRGN